MKHRKKIICFFCTCLLGCFCLFGFGLKTKATALPFYQVNLGDNYQTGASTYILISPYDTGGNYYLIYENVLNIALNLVRQNNEKAYINNNINYEIIYNQLYLIEYMPQSNIFYFYEIAFRWDIPNQTALTSVSVNYAFYIDEPDAQLNYFWVSSNGLTARFDGNYDQSQLENMIYRHVKNNFAYDWASEYGNGSQAYWYQQGYTEGYNAAGDGTTAFTPVFNLLKGIFEVIGSIFAVQLFPGVPLGLFFLVPLFFAALGLVLWIWRRN